MWCLVLGPGRGRRDPAPGGLRIMMPIPESLRDGVLGGLIVGVVFTVAGLLIIFMTGAESLGGLFHVALRAGTVYLSAGALGGALLFWCRSLLFWSSGGVIVGAIIFLPLTAAIALTAPGLDAEIVPRIVAAVLTAFLIGGVTGHIHLRRQ